MTYKQWFDTHALKHKNIVNKLLKINYSDEQIVDYFSFENMVKKENDFCYLYKNNKKCHDIKELNCYLCACPYFRFSDDGVQKYRDIIIKSKCDINNGSTFRHEDIVHQDCSSCTIPHHKPYTMKNFSHSWKEIMNSCEVDIK